MQTDLVGSKRVHHETYQSIAIQCIYQLCHLPLCLKIDIEKLVGFSNKFDHDSVCDL